MLDAPVSGYNIGAKTGTLTIMVDGPEDTFRECLPILNIFGENIVHMGTENGVGHSAKLCNQILCGLGILATCEAFTLAKKSNIDVTKMFSVVNTGVAASPLLNRFSTELLKANPKANRSKKTRDRLSKDLGLIIEAARYTGAPLPDSPLVQHNWDRRDP